MLNGIGFAILKILNKRAQNPAAIGSNNSPLPGESLTYITSK